MSCMKTNLTGEQNIGPSVIPLVPGSSNVTPGFRLQLVPSSSDSVVSVVSRPKLEIAKNNVWTLCKEDARVSSAGVNSWRESDV